MCAARGDRRALAGLGRGQDNNVIGLVQGAQAVSDHQGSPVGRARQQRFHEAVGRRRIEVFRGLVESHDRGGGGESPGHEKAATFAAGYGRASGADHGVESIGQGLKPLREAGLGQEFRRLVSGERRAGHPQVFVDRGGEDVCVLGSHRDARGQLVTVSPPRGNAVDQSAARLGRDDPREGRQQRRLPDARRADNRERRSGAQRERDTCCERWASRPPNGEIASLDDGGSLRDVMGLGGCLVVQEGANARRSLGAAHKLGGGGRQFGDPFEGGQRDEDDNGQEDLREGPRRRLRNSYEERADDGDAHRTHVKASREGGETSRACQGGAESRLGIAERAARAI